MVFAIEMIKEYWSWSSFHRNTNQITKKNTTSTITQNESVICSGGAHWKICFRSVGIMNYFEWLERQTRKEWNGFFTVFFSCHWQQILNSLLLFFLFPDSLSLSFSEFTIWHLKSKCTPIHWLISFAEREKKSSFQKKKKIINAFFCWVIKLWIGFGQQSILCQFSNIFAVYWSKYSGQIKLLRMIKYIYNYLIGNVSIDLTNNCVYFNRSIVQHKNEQMSQQYCSVDECLNTWAMTLKYWPQIRI